MEVQFAGKSNELLIWGIFQQATFHYQRVPPISFEDFPEMAMFLDTGGYVLEQDTMVFIANYGGGSCNDLVGGIAANNWN